MLNHSHLNVIILIDSNNHQHYQTRTVGKNRFKALNWFNQKRTWKNDSVHRSDITKEKTRSCPAGVFFRNLNSLKLVQQSTYSRCRCEYIFNTSPSQKDREMNTESPSVWHRERFKVSNVWMFLLWNVSVMRVNNINFSKAAGCSVVCGLLSEIIFNLSSCNAHS